MPYRHRRAKRAAKAAFRRVMRRSRRRFQRRRGVGLGRIGRRL